MELQNLKMEELGAGVAVGRWNMQVSPLPTAAEPERALAILERT